MRGAILAVGLLAAGICESAAAPAGPPGEALTVERIWGDPALSGPTPRALRFSPDGQSVTFLKPKETNARILDLWSSDLKSGAQRLLLDGAKLGGDESSLSEAEKARRERQRISDSGVVEYSWDGAGKLILAPVAGDLFLADPATGSVRRLTQTEGDEVDAKLSPKGAFASFTREQNLFLLDVRSGQERQVTRDGGGAISYGIAEFIAQEELDRYTGTWWSPNDAQLAFTKVDEGRVPLVVRADIGADGRTSTVQQYYPAAGEANAAVELLILNVGSGEQVRVDLGKGEDFYLARVDWAKDGKTLYVQRLARDQKRLDLLKVDAVTGQSRLILTETDSAWINLSGDFTALKGGGFLWTSERDGHRHIYSYDADGRLLRQVTRGAWPVRSIVGVNEAKGEVFLLASLSDPLQQQLYSVSFKRSNAPKQVTSGDGAWNATVNASGSAFIGAYSDPKTPPRTGLYNSDGRLLRWIEENALSPTHPYGPYAARYPAPEFGAIKASTGETLYTRVLKPVGFDPAKRYPAILFVYGGPTRQVVDKSWSSVSSVMRLMQERGYVVFSIDNRGTPNRSRDFERAIHGELGKLEVEDQLAGVAWLKTQPYIAADRVGVWGWSYGGFMTLALALHAPDAFAAAASFAPVTDWRLYDTAYTERYMGKPQDNPTGFGAADLTKLAAKLKTHLLLAHGLADDNVVFANSAAMMAALQRAGVQFETLVYPGQKHGLSAQPVRIHWTNALLAFFDRELQTQKLASENRAH